jgi:hypothetical protein
VQERGRRTADRRRQLELAGLVEDGVRHRT